MKNKKHIALLAMTLVLGSFPSLSAQQTITGRVFEDRNRNGKLDANEKPLAGVAVSNSVEVSVTDKNGKYSLPISEDAIVFVIKPTGYQSPVDPNNLPQFYYRHKPQGSPRDFKYAGVEPTAPLAGEVNFPLLAQKEDPNFRIIVFGDPQPYTQKELEYFRRGIVRDAAQNKGNAVFGISLGDLVGDNLSLHPSYAQAVREVGLPWYNVMGNHDMNYDAREDRLSDETFERNFGPNNYSFNYGNVHFIVLDNILYPHPQGLKGYQGGFREDQLKFVENDLKWVPKDKLVVVAFHIQLMPENSDIEHFRSADRQRLFDLLAPFPNAFMMSAHTHKQTQLFYTKENGWKGQNPLHEFNAGTTSGDWYSGTVDPMGVPTSTMRDGTFRGYSFIDFSHNRYNIHYKAAGYSPDVQMALYVPKVISRTRSSARLVANVFMGTQGDLVEYQIDGGEWKPMEYQETIDPGYMTEVLKWDQSPTLLQGRRPSNPEESKHTWMAPFGKLAVGKHTVQVRAKDRFGNQFQQSAGFEVQELNFIP